MGSMDRRAAQVGASTAPIRQRDQSKGMREEEERGPPEGEEEAWARTSCMVEG